MKKYLLLSVTLFMTTSILQAQAYNLVIKGGQVIVQEGSLLRRPHGAYLGKGE